MGESGRMLDSLPAIYRNTDTTGHLQRLLGVFEEVLFHNDEPATPGIEQQIEAIPSFFSPLGHALGHDLTAQDDYKRAPDRFLPWLATWVAFTPHALFSPEQLRVIISGIVPLYSKRGTRDYLETLLKLCFPEIREVEIDDNPIPGFVIGQAKIGEDTLFGDERPFWFRVNVDVQRQNLDSSTTESEHEFQQQVRTIIDFAKPAHTDYELRVYFSARDIQTMYTT
ncbi:phage tail protein [Nitrosovibrio tenuis]|uniref:Phage tail protein domain-containing protein n=1 Tax=Nitrosovibrio tenuis TaxID=1233 RepID=A0A1H7MM78_9PROT|nr:phage tail protein [Nitrosovibrio tenuis]SEL12221.1 phage tail protein domain-containing protein [Nitrosovibrio tenuis]